MVEIYRPTVKATHLLAANILALLDLRNRSQHDLAAYCKHSDVWLSYILSGKRDCPMEELDRIADFLGVETYQLLQPGVSRNSERRISERRSGKERRVSQSLRAAQELGATINTHHPRRRGGGPHGLIPESPTTSELRRLTADYERRISALISKENARRQAPDARKRVAKARHRSRATGRSDAEKD